MPDPNKQAGKFSTTDPKTAKVRKNEKFSGSQGKYSREFLCTVKKNGLTNDELGSARFKFQADGSGQWTKRATANGGGSFPGKSEMYKGGMSKGSGSRVKIAQNIRRS